MYSEAESFSSTSVDTVPVTVHGRCADRRTNYVAYARDERRCIVQRACFGAFSHFLPSHATCAAIADAPLPQPMSCGDRDLSHYSITGVVIGRRQRIAIRRDVSLCDEPLAQAVPDIFDHAGPIVAFGLPEKGRGVIPR